MFPRVPFSLFSHSLLFVEFIGCLLHSVSVLILFLFSRNFVLFSDHLISWKPFSLVGCRCTGYWSACAPVAGWELFLSPRRSASVPSTYPYSFQTCSSRVEKSLLSCWGLPLCLWIPPCRMATCTIHTKYALFVFLKLSFAEHSE